MRASVDVYAHPRDVDGLCSAQRAIKIVNPLHEASWNASILSHRDYCFFHGASWAEVLQTTYGYTPSYFCNYDQERLTAMLPVMEVNSTLTGRRGVCLPFTDECSPLVSDAALYPGLFRKVIEHGRARKWAYLEGRGGRRLAEDMPASLSFYGHTLPLGDDEKHLFAGCKSEIRTAVRKAERAGIEVEISQRLESAHTFFRLYCQTRKRHGLPPQPFRFFENIYRYVLNRNEGFIVTSWFERTPIAAALFVYLGKRMIYKFAASDPAFQRFRGSNLAIWHAIKWGVNNGFEALSFGRTSLWNNGLRRFKLGWGAEESLIEYIKYDFHKARFVSDRDRTAAWQTRVFQMLPIRLLRMIGTLLYRHIA
jgi:Acetyltransferase (GNAT) domain